MTTQQISMLYQSLSVSSKLHPWTQLYALSKHGCSLNTLYSKIQSFQQCNLLLIIQVKNIRELYSIFKMSHCLICLNMFQDIHRNVFGAFLSSPTIRAGSKSYTGKKLLGREGQYLKLHIDTSLILAAAINYCRQQALKQFLLLQEHPKLMYSVFSPDSVFSRAQVPI